VRENNSVSVTGRIAAIIVLVVVAFAMVNTACGKGGGGGNPVAPTTPAPVTPTPTPAEVTVSMAGLSAEGKEMIKMLLIPGTGATDDKNALDHVRRWADGQVISIYAPDFNPEHLVHAMTFWTEVSGGKLMFSVVTEESQAKVKLSRDPLPGNACAIASWSDTNFVIYGGWAKFAFGYGRLDCMAEPRGWGEKGIVVHEMGHVIGIGGHTPSEWDDIMSGSIDMNNGSALSSAPLREGVSWIYSQPTGARVTQ
jgi:hypothetical protein